jgi:hypothetical protein
MNPYWKFYMNLGRGLAHRNACAYTGQHNTEQVRKFTRSVTILARQTEFEL